MNGRGCSRDEAECMGAFGDRFRSRPAFFGADARTFDFDTGATNLVPVTAKAPALTAEQQRKAIAGKLAFNAATVSAAAAKTSVINQPYLATRAAADAEQVRQSNLASQSAVNLKGTGAWNFAGQDYGLLPVAAKIIVPLIATAATGGLAAPSVLAAAKSVASAKASVASGDIKGTVSLVKQADSLVTQAKAGVDSAKAVIADTVAAASAGIPDAKNGLALLVGVDTARDVPIQPTGSPIRSLQDALASSAAGRAPMPAPAAAFVRPAGTVAAVKPKAVQASVWSSMAPSDAAPSTDPKYLVLDSGQVLSGDYAKQAVPGFLVRFNGSVVRQ